MSQIRPEELDLCRQYRDLIMASADRHQFAPDLVAGIISRETGGTWDPGIIGDQGHGHGLGQIDDRSFGMWLASHEWTDPAVNIEMIGKVLAGKYNYLDGQGLLSAMTEAQAQQAAVAAYNCGEGNVAQVLQGGDDIDSRTAGHDYSADVLDRAAQFKEVFA